MTLADDLNKLRAEATDQLSNEMRVLFKQSMQDIAALNIVSASLKEGDTISEFRLPSVSGLEIDLAELLEGGPVVISFYRGLWCRFCNQELVSLQENLQEINNLKSALLGISPQLPSSTREMMNDTKITYELLHDKNNEVAKRFGLAYSFPDSTRELHERLGVDVLSFSGEDDLELPVPATYVVDKDRVIRYAFVDADYTRLPDPIDIITALRRIQDEMV